MDYKSRQKVIYDPFDIFKPSKSFLLDVIKQLKQQCHELLPHRHPMRDKHGFDWLLEPELNKQREKLITRIKEYEWRIKNRNNETNSNSITPFQIMQAKQIPIQDHYNGDLRKKGKLFVGLCVFHKEKTGSFVIYTDKNQFHCFGCQAQGDTIDFVMKDKNLTFINAIKYILKI